MIDVELLGVHQVIQNAPVIVLRERDGLRRLLPIYIGDPEARSIQLAVEGVEPQRPLTHDLILDLLGALGTDIDEILITDVIDGVFHAQLVLRTRGGAVNVSCRPSDAVAVAVRCGARIRCAESVMDIAGREATSMSIQDDDSDSDDLDVDNLSEGDESELLGEFRDFIENINPDDFKP